MDKFKDRVGIEEIDEDDITEEESREASLAERRRSEAKVMNRAGKDKIVAMNRHANPFKLVVIDPEGFDDCPKLVDSLKARKPIIINLEKIDSESAKKIFDFLSGATYALNGNVQKVANNIFIFAPDNVDISANMENRGFDFGSMDSNNWR